MPIRKNRKNELDAEIDTWNYRGTTFQAIPGGKTRKLGPSSRTYPGITPKMNPKSLDSIIGPGLRFKKR